MTDQRELDRVLGAFFAEGTNELADRVIDAALSQIDHTPQGPAMQRRFQTMFVPSRLAVAAVIAVVVVAGAVYLFQRGQPAVVGGPTQTPAIASPTPGASEPANPSPTPSAAAVVVPTVPSWTPTGSMGTPRSAQTATLLSDGKVLVVGGFNKNAPLATAELYDPASGTWTATGSMLAHAGGWWHNFTATLLPDGKVLVAGGSDQGRGPIASAELYDPRTGTWTATGNMIEARAGHSATLLRDGKVLVVGGEAISRSARSSGCWKLPIPTSLQNRCWVLASAELYDPSTGSWTATGSLVTGRERHVATLLPDGTVLVQGGDNSPEPVSVAAVTSAELYDPSSGSWTAAGKEIVGTPRYAGETATVLPDGRMLVVVPIIGVKGATGTSVALYHPSTGSWTAAEKGIVGTPRYSGYTATLLPDGRILVVGGDPTGNGGSLASADLYDPGSGTP